MRKCDIGGNGYAAFADGTNYHVVGADIARRRVGMGISRTH